MKFEWEEAKAAANVEKHKVSFEEASTVFQDDLSLTGRDPDHSIGEHRFVTFGLSARNRVLSCWFRIPNAVAKFGLSARAPRHGPKGKFMKKTRPTQDELRSEYRREDFGVMTRGKYADRCRKASNVVVISPEVKKAFPNAQAVNDALRGLLELAQATGLSSRSTLASRKAVTG